MSLCRGTQHILFLVLAIWLSTGCSEPGTDNDVEQPGTDNDVGLSDTDNDVEPGNAPTVEILTAPEAHTNESDALFSFRCDDEEGCSFFCHLNDGPSEPCDSPILFEGLDDGDHVFEIFAVNGFDQESDPAQWSWVIDTVAPEMSLSATVDEAMAQFEFECTNKLDCSFQCALAYRFGDSDWEMGAWEPCSSPYSVDGLGLGYYEFFVEATDEVGNQTTQSYQWTVGPAQRGMISAGTYHICGIPENGSLWCWGQWHLTHITTPEPLLENDADLATGWEIVSAGLLHNCAIRTDGSLWCWGDGDFGKLGLGDRIAHSTPQQVLANDANLATGWDVVSAGDDHTCAIRTDSSLWCWGRGDHGRLGLGQTLEYLTPQQVLANDANLATGWDVVSAGEDHTCAIRTDGSLWCWGNGQAGPDDTGEQLWPRHVLANDPDLATGWREVSAGLKYTCALRTDGSLWCWGNGADGRLGLGDTSFHTTPQQVLASDPDLATGWRAISALRFHTCAIRTDDSLWCWGRNGHGQLGLGHWHQRNTPQQVLASDPDLATGWDMVTTGRIFTCAIRTDGSLWCWGTGAGLGLGDTSEQRSPQFVESWIP